MSSEENKRDPELGNDGAPEGEAEELRTPEAEGAEEPEVVEGEVISAEDPVEVDEVAALADELEATRVERDQYLDALRRLKAEFENSRKRQERERERVLSMASERLVHIG